MTSMAVIVVLPVATRMNCTGKLPLLMWICIALAGDLGSKAETWKPFSCLPR
jgi:hypothetical protein